MLTPSLFEALAIHVICSLVLIFLVGGIFCSSSAKTVSLLSAVHFSLVHLFTYGDPSTFHFPKLSMVEYGLDVLLHTIRHIIILSKYDSPLLFQSPPHSCGRWLLEIQAYNTFLWHSKVPMELPISEQCPWSLTTPTLPKHSIASLVMVSFTLSEWIKQKSMNNIVIQSPVLMLDNYDSLCCYKHCSWQLANLDFSLLGGVQRCSHYF